jgi:septation ring formation regulator EzrA
MQTITDVEQLKNYFHYSLRSLRKSSFYIDDYELQLEKAFENRLREITDLMLAQAEKQMELLKDFSELYDLLTNLMDRSLEIGFTDEQRHRLNDLYELRKDSLKREKLEEINGLIETIHDINELRDYWNGVKWYLLNNRAFLGKEFENLVAKNFDRAMEKVKGVG